MHLRYDYRTQVSAWIPTGFHPETSPVSNSGAASVYRTVNDIKGKVWPTLTSFLLKFFEFYDVHSLWGLLIYELEQKKKGKEKNSTINNIWRSNIK